jgi:hypothetical protein
MTSECSDAADFRVTIDPAAKNGLRVRSQVMADKPVTIRRERIGRQVGHLDDKRHRPAQRRLGIRYGIGGLSWGWLPMGMYDEIQCDATLPDGYKGTGARFQTKSLPDPGMQRYKITSSGKLIDARGNDLSPDGYVTFYTNDPDSTWRECRARFLSGQLSEIVRVSKDADDQVRYGLASYRWFNTPSFLSCDDSEDSGVESQRAP